MIQQTQFPFLTNNINEQLELFSNEVFDNRIKRLNYALKISHRLHGWHPYKLDNLHECVKLFKVSYEDVIKQYCKVVGIDTI